MEDYNMEDYNMDWERENDWLDSVDCDYFENYEKEIIEEIMEEIKC